MAANSLRQFYTEFILLYKSFPCLWDITSKAYIDRAEKQKAYDQLVQKYKEIDKNATRHTVTKKINTLRTCYRRELGKISKSIQSGASEENVYQPTLWYFDLFTFLDEGKGQDGELPYDGCDTSAAAHDSAVEEIVEHIEIEYIDDETHQDSNDYDSTGEEERLLSPCSMDSSNVAEPSSGKRKYSSIDQGVDTRASYGSASNNVPFTSKREDAFDIFGKHVAYKLRSLNKQQSILAQKLINDVLFEGEMETLNRHCKISIPNDRRHRVACTKHEI
uniref:MADF domain-containing protein n=1 Tax=Anopheles quadriannulatus TaxID=34691 RepID=A0A182X0A5_ANOQN